MYWVGSIAMYELSDGTVSAQDSIDFDYMAS
jgi:hypothetical protein